MSRVGVARSALPPNRDVSCLRCYEYIHESSLARQLGTEAIQQRHEPGVAHQSTTTTMHVCDNMNSRVASCVNV